jgi:hypothetical protein
MTRFLNGNLLFSVQEFAAFLERDATLYQWWRVKMGYKES